MAKQSNTGLIIGGVVGLGLIGFGLWYWRTNAAMAGLGCCNSLGALTAPGAIKKRICGPGYSWNGTTCRRVSPPGSTF